MTDLTDDDMIRRGDAIGSLENRRDLYRQDSITWLQIQMGILAIRSLPATDATRAALDRAKAEGMREAAKIAQSAETPVFKDGWSAMEDAAAISTMSSISRAIIAAADKMEGKP